MTAQTYIALRDQLSGAGQVEFDDGFELVRACAGLLSDEASEAQGRDLVIRGLEALERFPEPVQAMWNDLVEAAGLYPYLKAEGLSGSAALRYEYHRSPYLSRYHLHREQQELSALLLQGRSLILSAPTSFGKSLLIEEVVASKRYKNIVVIQPTLALLDETRKKLAKYEGDYRIIVSTHQAPSDGANLILFTAERVVEYDKLPPVDFFVIDEFYKLSLSRDDERAIVLNQALYILLKHTKRFYLLGPNIKDISHAFVEDYGGIWRHSGYATVSVDVRQVYKGKNWKRRDERREKELFDTLSKLRDPTIVYCGSPERCSDLAEQYVEHLRAHGTRDRWLKAGTGNTEIVEWLKSNVHERWALGEALTHGIGVHHGHLPRHLGSAIVDAFNRRSVRCLFCTSTLIEGVNTAARNVILFDQTKGLKPIDFFDYKNIVGRSGRMKIHYIGQVFEFHPEPAQSELDVDVPLFSQVNAPLELLVQLDGGDVEVAARGRLDGFLELPSDLRAVIRKNSGIPVEGQIAFVNELTNSADHYYSLLHWASMPKYEQLEAVLDLCWRFLLRPKETKAGVRSHKQLTFLTFQYCHGKSLAYLISQSLASDWWRNVEPDEYKRVQKVVKLVLGVSRQWFDYKLPKLLSAASELQAYVYTGLQRKPGNYGYLSARLENAFFRGALSVLLDYDIPASALRKIERFFASDDDWATIEKKLQEMDLSRCGLLPYELNKVRVALGTVRRTRQR